MKNSFLTFFFILPILCFSQKIEWGGFNSYKGTTIDIIQNNEDFFTLRNKKTFIFNSTHLSKFNQFNQLYSEKLKRNIGGRSANIIGFELIDDQPFVFLTDEYQSKNILYLQRLNNKGLAAGPVEEIMEYEMPKSWFNKGFYSFQISKNKEYILLTYEIETDKSKLKTIGYQIIDKKLKVISKGILKLEQLSNAMYAYDLQLLNNGNLYLLKKITRANQELIFKKYQQITDIELHEVKNDTLKSIPINKEHLKFTDLKFDANLQQLSIVGLYTQDESSYNIEGAYYFNYDYNNNKIINEGKTIFDSQFITQNWSERAKKRALEREAKGKESPALYDYYIKGIIPLKDSSLIYIMEQFYVRTVSYTDPRTGYVSTRYIYHYNDIIIGKVNSDNKIAWLKMIPKSQVSENDGGYYNSFEYFNTENQLTLFFNDAATMYDKLGSYKQNADFILFSRLRKILATAEINLETGEYSRRNTKFITKRIEITIPKLYSNNPNNQTFILFLRKGSKENFGIIKY